MSEPKASRTVVVNKPEGLHARPAELFVKLAQQYDAQIYVIKDNQRVDGKSMLNVLSLAAVEGTRLELEAVGHDAEAALDALQKLFHSDFADDGTTVP
jgi:phosphocarrier protein